ncbi:MAG: diguanylate cyclase [Clostridia bacterium]|nr:diguanylate cyclase [Clostridia bacterium]
MKGAKSSSLQSSSPVLAEFLRKNVLSLLSDNISAGVTVCLHSPQYPDFPCIYVNERLPQMLGYNDSQEYLQAIDSKFINCIYPEDRQFASEEFLRGFLVSDSYKTEYRLQEKSGEILWVRDCGRLVTKEDGTQLVVSVYIDITDMIMLRKELQNKNNEYDEINRTVPSGICKCLLDDRLTIVYANDFFYQLSGYTPLNAAAAGLKDVAFLLSEEDFTQARRIIADNLRKGDYHFELEVRQRHRNGYLIWVLSRCSYDTQTKMLICAVLDITDRKEAERRLQISEEQYRLAVLHSGKLFFRYNIATATAYFDQRDAEVLDLPLVVPEFFTHITAAGAIASETVDNFMGLYNHIQSGVDKGSAVFKMQNSSGRLAWYKADYSLIYEDYKQPVSAIVSLEDISKLREKELAYAKWQHTHRQMDKDKIIYVEYNLTQDKVDIFEGGLFNRIPNAQNKSCSQLISYFINTWVHSEEKEQALAIFSRENLLAKYHMGENDLIYEVRIINSAGQEKWVSASAQMLPDPYSDDIKGNTFVKDIDEQKREQLALHRRLNSDSLTGLLNRNAFKDQFKAIAAASDENARHAFIMLDLDNFKQLNDKLGHLVGDKVLVDISQSLKTALRADDLIGRIGGDEFMILLKNLPRGEALEKRAERICLLLAKNFGGGLFTSGSMGIAMYPHDGCDFEDLYKKADLALYAAKKSGRNRFVFYEPLMQSGEWQIRGELPAEDHTEVALSLKQLTSSFAGQPSGCSIGDDDERYRVIVEQAGTVVLDWKAEGDEFYASPAAWQFAFMGKEQNNVYSDEEDIRQAILTPSSVHLKDWPQAQSFLQAIRQGSCYAEITVRLKKNDGSYIWCKVTITVVRSRHGAVRRTIMTVDDVDAQTRDLKTLEFRAENDCLTGALNYDTFKQQVSKLLQKRWDCKYALIYSDIKNFKFINDIYGYDVGDRTLRFWAKSITSFLRPDETFARVAADNFVVLRRYKCKTELYEHFERFKNLLADYEELASKKFRLEICSGIYCIEKQEDVLCVDDMLARSIMAQKKAKELAGSHLIVYTDEMRRQVIREKAIEADMYTALVNHEFCIYFQPKVDINNGNKIVGAEALARWYKKPDDLIMPADFIPVFEKNGFITELDHFAFEEVCRYLQKRIKGNKKLVPVSVNVSRISVLQNDFCERYINLKKEYEIPDGLIELECTESMLAENLEELKNIMDKMRSEGFLFSLDDFGSGYSSLNMLRDIKVDVLKLDRQFMEGDFNEESHRIVLNSIIDMAKALDIQVVSEGVESDEQVKMLRDLCGSIVQGYVFSKPVPIEQFEKMLKD